MCRVNGGGERHLLRGRVLAPRSAAEEWGYFYTEPVAGQHLLYHQPVIRPPLQTQLLFSAGNVAGYRDLYNIFHGQHVSPAQPFPFYSSLATKPLAESLTPYPYKPSLSGFPLNYESNRLLSFNTNAPTFAQERRQISGEKNVIDISTRGSFFRTPYAKEKLLQVPKRTLVTVEKMKKPVYSNSDHKGFSLSGFSDETSTTPSTQSPDSEGSTNGSVVKWRPPGSEKFPVTLLILQPQAKAVSGINGTSIATPVSRAVVPAGYPVDIHFDPRAVAIAGPGGTARAHSDLFLSILTTKAPATHT